MTEETDTDSDSAGKGADTEEIGDEAGDELGLDHEGEGARSG